MPDNDCRAVVAGVDGSHAALNAVRWVAVEAVDRAVPLRIVHAVAPGAPAETMEDDVLAQAEDAARTVSGSVRVAVVRTVGVPGEVLVCESRRAAMV